MLYCKQGLSKMEDTVFSESQTAFSPEPKKRNQKRFALFLVALLIIIVFSVFITIANTKKPTATTTTTTSATVEETTTTTEEEVSPGPEETSTPTPKPTANPVDKKTGLNRSELSVAVQNGSGEVGVAGKMAAILKDLGYNVASTGNADNYDYQNVTIQVKSDSSDFLSLLKSDLSGTYTIGDTSSDLDASTSEDAIVIIGK
jgi:hypothetical protein